MARKMTATTADSLYKALRNLPTEAKRDLRKASKGIAAGIAVQAQQIAPSGYGNRAKHVGKTIRAVSDTVPAIKIGGKRMLPGRSSRPSSDSQRVGDMTMGTEFGGSGGTSSLSPYYREKGGRAHNYGGSTAQFRPHLGQTGYALWPAVRMKLGDGIEEWADALYDAAIDSARRGGFR